MSYFRLFKVEYYWLCLTDLGWSPSLSSAEAAPTLCAEAALSATSHSHSSPFSDRKKKRADGEVQEEENEGFIPMQQTTTMSHER